MSTYKIGVTPRLYQYRGKAIPSSLTLLEGVRYIMGCGADTPQASVLALQGRGSSLAVRLGALIEQSGNAELIRKAEQEIKNWNKECEELFTARD